MNNIEKRTKLLNIVSEMFPDTNSSNLITRQQAIEAADKLTAQINEPVNFKMLTSANKQVSRGVYALPGYTASSVQVDKSSIEPKLTTSKSTLSVDISESLIPPTDLTYVPFGIHKDVEKVIKSKIFYPTYIYGPTGNGKSTTVEQICSKQNRPIIRINLNSMTDEDQLIGTKTLTDGNVEVIEGPIVRAMRMGYVLLLDEIDAGNANTLLCLQPILEGKPFYFKLKNEMIIPAAGFNIFATANTKGKGSEDGRYMFTNVLNEAFLERFPNTFEQEWAPATTEKKIVAKELESVGKEDKDFADKLVTWATVIRSTFDEGGCDEVISTRRLVHIVKTYGIFGNKLKAIQFCLNRFDTDTKVTFLDLYTKIDAGIDPTVTPAPAPEVADPSVEIPF